MAIKLETRDASLEALHQDAVEAAQECFQAYEEMLEAGVQIAECTAIMDNIQMCMTAVENSGLEGLKVLDCMGDIQKAFGIRALKDVDAAQEGFIDTIKSWAKKVWDFIVKWWNKFIDWIKGLFSSATKDTEELKEKVKKTKGKKKFKDKSKVQKPQRTYDNSGMSDRMGLNASLEKLDPSMVKELSDVKGTIKEVITDTPEKNAGIQMGLGLYEGIIEISSTFSKAKSVNDIPDNLRNEIENGDKEAGDVNEVLTISNKCTSEAIAGIKAGEYDDLFRSAGIDSINRNVDRMINVFVSRIDRNLSDSSRFVKDIQKTEENTVKSLKSIISMDAAMGEETPDRLKNEYELLKLELKFYKQVPVAVKVLRAASRMTKKIAGAVLDRLDQITE